MERIRQNKELIIFFGLFVVIIYGLNKLGVL